MIVTKTSDLTGKTTTMDLPTVTQERLDKWKADRQLVQQAFPELTKSQREFLMTGITDEEWDRAFAFPDEDE